MPPANRARRVEDAFVALSEEQSDSGPHSAEYLLLKVREILFDFRRYLHPQEGADGPQRAGVKGMADNAGLDRNILAFIEARLREPLSAERIAAALHYSRSQVYRTVRSATGETLGQYLKRRRVARAMRLLTTTDLPVTQIAASVGMRDLPHFCKVFRG